MKVSGYDLREAIKQWESRRDTLQALFPDTILKFPDDVQPSPDEVSEQLLAAESALATLQSKQAQYNANSRLVWGGSHIPLATAVKLLGGLSRTEKLWRAASTAPKREKWQVSTDKGPRDPNMVHPVRQLTFKEAQDRSEKLTREIRDLKVEIAHANAVMAEIDLDPALLS